MNELINLVWVGICTALVFFMQAGFALVGLQLGDIGQRLRHPGRARRHLGEQCGRSCRCKTLGDR